MKKNLFTLFVIFALSSLAQPGKDGAYTVSSPNQVLNKYCPVAANINAGVNTLTIASGPGFTLCPGDLIMVYQAQGASISFTNAVNYGSISNYNSAGLYEFKYVQSISGNVITVQTTFTNSYQVAGRVQVIKVPQYTTLTVNTGAGIVAKAWKDTTIFGAPYRFGGLVVIHAANIVNNGSITASGAGFRGGFAANANYINNITSYVTSVSGEGAEKGEGVFGYQTDYDPNGGRYGRGAGGNGGGGGNSTNSPGGGGANGNNGNTWSGQGVMIVNATNPLAAWALDPGYIANGNALTNSSGGGRGGYCWAGVNLNALVSGPGVAGWGGDSRREAGGLGGRPLTNINAETRIYFGGGGGAGHENNVAGSSGANGGGIVYLIATGALSGTGNIFSIGNTAGNSVGCHCDGVGGGGAGGSIVIKSPSIAGSQAVNASGGMGGNQLITSNESEGPGGGGGGGFAALAVGPVVPLVNGGNNGSTNSAAVTEMTYNGATQGASGQTGTVSANFIAFNPLAPAVVAAPTVTQSSCTNTNNAFDLGLTFNPPNPSYTINWSSVPNGVVNNTQTAANGGIAPGVYNATILVGTGNCVSGTVTSFTVNAIPGAVSFSVNPSYSITCSQPTVLIGLNGAYNYTWTNGISPSQTGSLGVFTPTNASGTWSVTGVNLSSGCSQTQTFTIAQNTLAPVNTVSPSLQTINCSSASAVTFSGTVTNLTVNIQHDWYSPLSPPPAGPPVSTSNNTLTIFSGNMPPGVYTLVTTNLVNGCTAQKTITITSLSAFPIFNVASPTNFSVGCSPLNQTTISIINPVSTQTPPATCSYTFLPPTFTGAVTPSIVLGIPASTVTQIPGTWTVIVQDNSNFCRTQLVVPVIQNTVAPHVSASMLTQTLTCRVPTILATGSSSTSNTDVSWLLPISPPNFSQPTLVIGTNTTGPNNSTTSLNYANFTVVATNTINACQSSSVVNIYQNFKPPISTPTISIGTATAIYCTAATNPVVLTTGNSTTTSGGGPLAFPVPYLWEGPSPQTTVTGASSYSAYVAGIYTLTIMDNYNGCVKTGTVNVLDKTQPPVMTEPVASSTVDCGASKATLLLSVTGASTGLMYWFDLYPPGTAFSPTAAPIANINPYLSGTSSPSILVSQSGFYEYIVSNTLTGCQATGTFIVDDGTITADFDPDKFSGYAPLGVNFTNNSSSSLGTGSITSIWDFGNGSSQTTTNNVTTNANYIAPGSYTVHLTVSKGSCVDTTEKIIVVEMPSKLEVPNIFTPNGDGVNDIFFLKAAALGEINAIIFDRWGNRVYQTSSSTGNIAWDGKNMQGKECAAGVYFYIITADGKDAQHYEQKGNVSLFR